MQPDPLEAEADALADFALRELGDFTPDPADEYTDLCDYAGCYPWLGEIIHCHPLDDGLPGTMFSSESDSRAT